MSKYYIALMLYIFGMLIFAYACVTHEANVRNFKRAIEDYQLNPKKTYMWIAILAILFSVTWPISLVYDPIMAIIKKRS